jgi:hypothetical protein
MRCPIHPDILLIKGAFWECLAHKKFRDKAVLLKNAE